MDAGKELGARHTRARRGPPAVGALTRLEHSALELVGGTVLTLGRPRATPQRAALGLVGVAALGVAAGRRSLVMTALGVTSGWLVLRELRASRLSQPAARELEGVVTVGRPADELGRLWRDRDALRAIMQPFADVTADGERTRWRLRALGRTLDWEMQLVEDRPGDVLRWQSLPGSTVHSEGAVQFRPAPGQRGTEVRLRFRFTPGRDLLGQAALKLLGAVPRLLLLRALRRFKSLAESGEIPTTAHQPAARADGQ